MADGAVGFLAVMQGVPPPSPVLHACFSCCCPCKANGCSCIFITPVPVAFQSDVVRALSVQKPVVDNEPLKDRDCKDKGIPSIAPCCLKEK